MSIVADVRQMIQDLVTPDMQAIKVRLDNIEKQIAEMNSDQKEFRGEMKQNFAEFERRAEQRHQEILDKIRVTVDYTVVLERLAKVEQELEQKRLKQ